VTDTRIPRNRELEEIWDDMAPRCLEERMATSKSPAPVQLQFILGGENNLGLELQVTYGDTPLLVVGTVDPDGPLSRAMQDKAGLCPGDVIIEVQGRTGPPDELVRELRSLCGQSLPASMVVQPRVRTFTAQLLREGPNWQRLGLSVQLRSEVGVLLVAAVHAVGLVAEWNAQRGALCICVGDRISSINSISHDIYAMYAAALATSQGCTVMISLEAPPRSRSHLMQAWAAQATSPDSHEPLETL